MCTACDLSPRLSFFFHYAEVLNQSDYPVLAILIYFSPGILVNQNLPYHVEYETIVEIHVTAWTWNQLCWKKNCDVIMQNETELANTDLKI